VAEELSAFPDGLWTTQIVLRHSTSTGSSK